MVRKSGKISKILDNLYLGNNYCASCKNDLTKLRIKSIVCIGCSPKFKDTFDYLEIHIRDKETSDLSKYIEISGKYIDDNLSKNNAVLVHCKAGISRSPSIIIAYLITYKKYSFNDAFEFVKLKRPTINPRQTFIEQLKMLDNNEVISIQ